MINIFASYSKRNFLIGRDMEGKRPLTPPSTPPKAGKNKTIKFDLL